MLHTELNQQDTKFKDLILSLSETEKKYLDAILAKEKLTLDSLIKNSGGVLVLAVLNNQMSLGEKLLKAGANPHEMVGEESFLAYAAERGKDNIVSLLIQHGANRFLADKSERALRCAAAQNRTSTCKILLAHTPYDPIKDELTIIDCAKFKNINYLKLFFSSGIHSEKTLITALNGAIRFDSAETSKFLLENMTKESISKAMNGIDLTTCKTSTLTLLKSFGIEAAPKNEVSTQPKVIYVLNGIEKIEAVSKLYQMAEECEAGKKARPRALQLTADVPGLYSPLPRKALEDSILHAGLKSNGKLGYVGYFEDIGITIINQEGKSALDISGYLEIFKLLEMDVKKQLDELSRSDKTINQQSQSASNICPARLFSSTIIPKENDQPTVRPRSPSQGQSG